MGLTADKMSRTSIHNENAKLFSRPLVFNWQIVLHYRSSIFKGLWMLFNGFTGALYVMKDTSHCNDVNTVCQTLYIPGWDLLRIRPPETITLIHKTSGERFEFFNCYSCNGIENLMFVTTVYGHLDLFIHEFRF